MENGMKIMIGPGPQIDQPLKKDQQRKKESEMKIYPRPISTGRKWGLSGVNGQTARKPGQNDGEANDNKR